MTSRFYTVDISEIKWRGYGNISVSQIFLMTQTNFDDVSNYAQIYKVCNHI